MDVVASRLNSLPPPAWVVFDDLVNPLRHNGRPWLTLLDDERVPDVLEAERPTLVVWSSIWTSRPDALIRFDLDGPMNASVRWSLMVEAPVLDDRQLRHFGKRIGDLVFANLRYTYGQ
jgi:hypothetical protein